MSLKYEYMVYLWVNSISTYNHFANYSLSSSKMEDLRSFFVPPLIESCTCQHMTTYSYTYTSIVEYTYLLYYICLLYTSDAADE